MKDRLKYSWEPSLEKPVMVVSWTMDAAKLGTRVTDYLNASLELKSFCEIEPLDFFPMNGVSIEDDLVQFPESTFYASQGHDLVVLKTTPPGFEWYRFLNHILEVALRFHAREVYCLGAMVSMSAHTTPRKIMGTFSSAALKSELGAYNISNDLDYETPAGQRPTLNSFFIWAAQKKNIPAASLWVPVPFYLMSAEDPSARRIALNFLAGRLGIKLDFLALDEEIERQNRLLAEMRNGSPELDQSIRKLESNVALSEEEGQSLARETEKVLKAKKG